MLKPLLIITTILFFIGIGLYFFHEGYHFNKYQSYTQASQKLLKQLDNSINFNFLYKNEKTLFNCDKEQLNRVFFNLIKNSIESIQQKAENGSNFEKRISIELIETNTHIIIMLIDSGMGFGAFTKNIKDIVNPYFTTKKNGTGLGLSIVNKIVSDHSGNINFIPIQDGAKIKISFAKNDS